MRIRQGIRGKKTVKSWGSTRSPARGSASKGGSSRLGAAMSRLSPEHTRSMLKLGAAIFVALVLLGDFGSYAFARHQLIADQIQVSGNFSLPTEMIREHLYRRLSALGQANLLTADLSGLARWLEMRVPALASVEIAVNAAGGTLYVVVSERRAVAKLAAAGDVLYLAADGTTYPVYVRSGRELPLVTGFPSADAAAGRDITALPVGAGLLKALNAMSPLVYNLTEQIQINNPNYFDLKLTGGTVVKIDPATYVVKQEQLERILKARQRDSLAYIDLRFVRVVVKDRQIR